MKNKSLLLVKNRLISQLGINTVRYEKDQKKRNNKILNIVAVVVVLIIMAGYCGAYAYGMCAIGYSNLIPLFAFFLCSVISLIFTIFRVPSELFGLRDQEFLMSIPVRSSSIIASRFIVLYLWNTCISLLVMVPMGVVFAMFVKPEWYFYLTWIVGFFIACFIPTTIAVIIGTGLTAIVYRFKRSSMVSTILMIAVVSVTLVLPMVWSVKSIQDDVTIDLSMIENIINGIAKNIRNIYFPVRWFEESALRGQIWKLILLILVSIGWYLLFVLILSTQYKKISTAVSTFRSSSNYQLGVLKKKSPIISLFNKEMKLWLGTSIYFSNTVIGVIMAVLFSGMILFIGVDGMALTLPGIDGKKIITNASVYIVMICIGMCCSTASSLSLEGKNLWILQSMPIPVKVIINSKILMNLVITIPGSLISSTLLVIALRPSFLMGVVLYIMPVSYSVLSAFWGMLMNLKMPNYSWESAVQVVKQSMAMMLAMFPMMIIGIILAVIANVLPIDGWITGLVYTVIFVVLSCLLYRHIINKYKRL